MRTFKPLLLLVTLLLLLVPASASAATPGPGWTIESLAAPSSFSTADNEKCLKTFTNQHTECDFYEVTARNAGSRASEGAVTIGDTVPSGLAVEHVELHWPALWKLLEPFLEEHGFTEDSMFTGLELLGICSKTPLHCTTEYGGSALPVSAAPDEEIRLNVRVTVESPEARPLANRASISGGGAATATTESHNAVGSPPPFGFSLFGFAANAPNGTLDTQAGDHPYELTTTIGLNSDMHTSVGALVATSVEDVRDVVTELPVGFVGSILAAPECTFAQLTTPFHPSCPSDTIVGHIFTRPQENTSIESPIYNMTPEKGVPAEFGYYDGIDGSHVFYAHVVPSPQGYRLEVINPEIPQIPLTHITVTFYGNPVEKDQTNNAPIPFFTNPTDCGGEAPAATIYMDSWQNPAKFNADGTPANVEEEVAGRKVWAKMESKSPPVTGCDSLRFPAEITAQPTTHEADKPSGMEFAIKLPQSETIGVPATPTLQTAIVHLPEGFTVDPAAGNGLAACSEAQIGWLGPLGPGEALSEKGLQNFNAAEPSCPEASKIGSLELESPLVSHALKGEMFLANQNENPYGSTLAAYVVVHDPITGVLIKIAGKFVANPNNGQLTAEFAENPNLPFSNLELHFFGGPRAELATPESCGTFAVATALSPWSAPESGPAASPFDSFLIDEACPGGFNPTFTAGSQNLQAGAYTPFVASFGRSDTDQELQGLSVTLPPGLLADVGSVPLCDEAQANAGTCPESSQVGTVQTGVGPGPDPLFVGGKAYLTGPYNGGPYGLSVVVPAVAGPFNFGTVVVRQSIRINPETAQVTDVSDAFPTIIDGIPLRMRRVDVTLNRPGFTFNPTNCNKLGFNGSISGSPLGSPRRLVGTIGYATEPGATSTFTTPSFQVTNCQTLKFQPKFSVSTGGKTTKADGASLSVKLTYPTTAQGVEANITRVKVDLPKQLPSRLTTLQKACTAKQFELNPANCPKESKIGYATVHTPILPLPLSGPAIFVSHGGEAFPSLIMVLQGNGITLDLVGTTFISKAGITSSTFKTVPDAPVGTFELTLPEGKYSALAANGNLCTSKLAMPTEFLGQNGAKINESTPISVTGCKPAITVTSHKVKGKTATIKVSVPSAGTLVATASAIKRSTKRVAKAGTVTIGVSLSSHDLRVLAKNPHQRVNVDVKLRFTSKHGAPLTAHVRLLMR